ncbi:MAG: hypothetical protein ACT4NL_05945 [Pseudomarimonas sp.]
MSFPPTFAVLPGIDADICSIFCADIRLNYQEISVNVSNSRSRLRKRILLTFFSMVTAAASLVAAAEPLPVLMVLANRDFNYADYAATRASLEARGLPVVVAAGESQLAQPQGVGAAVRPDLVLSRATAGRYSAIVFTGGWGASSYQYAFEGTYQNSAYRPKPTIIREVNRLIEEFTAADKPVAAICHGVTVLAWARVDGVSPLQGRVVVGPAGGTPAFRLDGVHYPDAEHPARWQMEFNGAVMLTSRSIGNPLSASDDVWVDGKIITAENYEAVGRFAEVIAQSVAANRE